MNGANGYGPEMRKHLLRKLDETIEANRTELHPEDAEMAPLELRSWMKACDTRWDQETLEFGTRRAIALLRNRGGMGNHFAAMRTPHAIYAVAALNARFGVDLTAELGAVLETGALA